MPARNRPEAGTAMDAAALPFYPAFGFRLDLSAENLAYLRHLYEAGRITDYLRHIHPQLSCPHDCPRAASVRYQGRHANSRWRDDI